MPPISAEAERRIMSKKVSETEHNFNTDFDKLLNDFDHGKVGKVGESFFKRPAYYGTGQCLSHPAAVNRCTGCPYYCKRDDDLKLRCRYPWNNPKDADKVIFKELPCQK